ncbi:MAG: hypothetical protein ACP5C4_07185 [Methanomicrobiales archaeon]
MNPETILLAIFGGAVVFLLFIMHVMHRRIQQLQYEIEDIMAKVEISDAEIDLLGRTVERIRNLR